MNRLTGTMRTLAIVIAGSLPTLVASAPAHALSPPACVARPGFLSMNATNHVTLPTPGQIYESGSSSTSVWLFCTPASFVTLYPDYVLILSDQSYSLTAACAKGVNNDQGPTLEGYMLGGTGGIWAESGWPAPPDLVVDDYSMSLTGTTVTISFNAHGRTEPARTIAGDVILEPAAGVAVPPDLEMRDYCRYDDSHHSRGIDLLGVAHVTSS